MCKKSYKLPLLQHNSPKQSHLHRASADCEPGTGPEADVTMGDAYCEEYTSTPAPGFTDGQYDADGEPPIPQVLTKIANNLAFSG